jgi:hypothetical protein
MSLTILALIVGVVVALVAMQGINSFSRGDFAVFNHTIAGGGGVVVLGIKGQSGDIEQLLFDVTNNKHGGGTARIAGKQDIKATLHASLDLDEQPWAAPFNLATGISGVGLFGINPTKGFSIPFIVGKVHWEQAVDKEISWSIDVSYNVIAGVFTYPTQTAF